jgi:hypothetical protein
MTVADSARASEAVASWDPSSTTMTSPTSDVCRRSDLSSVGSVAASFRAGMTTETEAVLS